MKVLHVSLGLPPLRTGGMTRYCTDLALEQVKSGDEVSLLFPGRFLPGHTWIHRGKWQGIRTFEVVNPLPVALTYGIDDPERFCGPCNNVEAYRELLDTVVPDVVHVHCFQGIHQEFFFEAKHRRIPLLFTTHDYYPMCPRCTFITPAGEQCDFKPSREHCAVCNRGKGMTYRKSFVMQSRLYARFKESALVRSAGKHAKRSMRDSGHTEEGVVAAPSEGYTRAYGRLLKYNRDIFSLFDTVLSNSRQTEDMYQRFFPSACYEYLPITHAGLTREEKSRSPRAEGQALRVAYFGGSKAYKGVDTLAEASRILGEKGVSVQFDLYGDDYAEAPRIRFSTVYGRVSPQSIRGILREHDAVVVPSKCHETFGFVVLEALCAGTSVVCSDAVGASELVEPKYIFHAGDAVGLAEAVKRLAESSGTDASIVEGYPLSMSEQAARLIRTYLANSSVVETL